MSDDRQALSALVAALDASPRTLKRDVTRATRYAPAEANGDWGVRGTQGHIYPDGNGFLLYCRTDDYGGCGQGSIRRWSNIKDRLAFCCVTQDGDDEGCLHLDHLPTANEAELIREALGIRKRRHLTDGVIAKARASMERARATLKRPLSGVGSVKAAPSNHGGAEMQKTDGSTRFIEAGNRSGDRGEAA